MLTKFVMEPNGHDTFSTLAVCSDMELTTNTIAKMIWPCQYFQVEEYPQIAFQTLFQSRARKLVEPPTLCHLAENLYE